MNERLRDTLGLAIVFGLVFPLVGWAKQSAPTHASTALDKPSTCPTTPSSSNLPPDKHAADFSDTWLQSPDSGIWVAVNGRWRAGQQKVLWSTTDVATDALSVRGSRIDDDAPPLAVTLGGRGDRSSPAGSTFRARVVGRSMLKRAQACWSSSSMSTRGRIGRHPARARIWPTPCSTATA